MVRLAQIGSAGSAAGLGVCVFLAGCGTQITSTDATTPGNSQTTLVEESSLVDAPAGPTSGEIDEMVLIIQQELDTLDGLEGNTQLQASRLSIDFHIEPDDYRSVNGLLLEVESTSDDGHYVIGRIGQTSVARISLTCSGDRPADLLITDVGNRQYAEEWVPIIDRLVPSFVAVSGCESSLLGAPTDCLDLPDDPAACIPGEGVEG